MELITNFLILLFAAKIAYSWCGEMTHGRLLLEDSITLSGQQCSRRHDGLVSSLHQGGSNKEVPGAGVGNQAIKEDGQKGDE